MSQNFAWQHSYKAAMIEVDSAQLFIKIERARASMRARLEELATEIKLDRGLMVEYRAIDDALRTLQILQKMELRTPSMAPVSGRQGAAAQ